MIDKVICAVCGEVVELNPDRHRCRDKYCPKCGAMLKAKGG